MSNCYASYYTRIPYFTEEQKAWLAKQLDTQEDLNAALEKGGWDWEPQSEGEGEWNFGEEEWIAPNPADKIVQPLGYLLLTDCEANQADVAFLALVYNDRFRCLDDTGWVMSVAYTADKVDEDTFGGCSYGIYKGQSCFISTWDYEKFCAEQDTIEAAITAWQAAF